MPKDSGDARVITQPILTIGLVIFAITIVCITSLIIAGIADRKEILEMKVQVNKSNDKKGSQVFVAIMDNAETDDKISDAELTALRFQYTTFLNRKPDTLVEINNNDTRNTK